MQIVITDVPVPSQIGSTDGPGRTTTGSSGGKGRPGQEMHHGILLYHVAEMRAEKDENGIEGKR